MFEQVQDRTRTDISSAPKLSDETFFMLRDFIYTRTGIYFPEKKKYLLEGRLVKRLQLLKLDNFEDYLHLLKYGSTKTKRVRVSLQYRYNERDFFLSE